MSKGFQHSLSHIQKNILKVMLMIVSLFIMYFQLKSKGNVSELKEILISLGSDFDKLFVLVVVFLFMYLNWGIEAFKWQYLLRNFNPIKYSKSLMATLSGVTFSLFMPNRTGEYIGRVFHLKRGIRIKAILATVLGSMSQLFVTILFGLMAILLSLDNWSAANEKLKLAFYAGLMLFIIFILVSILYDQIKSYLLEVTWLKKVRKFLIVFSFYSIIDLVKISFLSIFRYLVFATQFVLLLLLFCPELNITTAIIRVMVFFFVQTFIPGTGITELSTRGALALTLFDGIIDNSAALLATTYILWTINLFVPAIIGALFILLMKIFD